VVVWQKGLRGQACRLSRRHAEVAARYIYAEDGRESRTEYMPVRRCEGREDACLHYNRAEW